MVVSHGIYKLKTLCRAATGLDKLDFYLIFGFFT